MHRKQERERYLKIRTELKEIAESYAVKPVKTYPVGRAAQNLTSRDYESSEECSLSACTACSYPIIMPDGRVIACIGPLITLKNQHPLVLGSLREKDLKTILDEAQLNPILHAIRIWGPRKLISVLKEKGLGEYLPDRYIKDSACDACYSLFSNEKITEFLFQFKDDADFKQYVAYARVHYLSEKEMINHLG